MKGARGERVRDKGKCLLGVRGHLSALNACRSGSITAHKHIERWTLAALSAADLTCLKMFVPRSDLCKSAVSSRTTMLSKEVYAARFNSFVIGIVRNIVRFT